MTNTTINSMRENPLSLTFRNFSKFSDLFLVLRAIVLLLHRFHSLFPSGAHKSERYTNSLTVGFTAPCPPTYNGTSLILKMEYNIETTITPIMSPMIKMITGSKKATNRLSDNLSSRS